MPFVLSTQIPSTPYFQYNITNLKNNVSGLMLYPVDSTSFVYLHKNWYSYEPISYRFTLYTSNLLYIIWEFVVVEQNCQPQTLPLVFYEFGGLPEDTGTLTIAYTHQYSTYISANSPNYFILLTFPS